MAYEELLDDARSALASSHVRGYDLLGILCPLVCHARVPGFGEFYESAEDLHPSSAQRIEAHLLATALQGRLNAWYRAGGMGDIPVGTAGADTDMHDGELEAANHGMRVRATARTGQHEAHSPRRGG